jgi:hypothetical protein
VDGIKRLEAQASLRGWVNVLEIMTTAGPRRTDGASSWDGQLSGLNQHHDLVGVVFELHLSNGPSRLARFEDVNLGTVKGMRETPF